MKKYEFNEIVKFYEDYEKEFKKCSLTPSILYDLQEHGKITVTIKKKNKNYKVVSEKTEAISLENFMNCISGIAFFHDRISKNYTKFGYIVDTLKCVSPDGSEKIERVFTYGN